MNKTTYKWLQHIGSKDFGEVFVFRSKKLEEMHVKGIEDTRVQFVCLAHLNGKETRAYGNSLIGNLSTGAVKYLPNNLDVKSIEISCDERKEILIRFLPHFC